MAKKIMAILAIVLAVAANAYSADKGSIELKHVAEVQVAEVTSGGVKAVKLVSADKAAVVPGDTIYYTTTYKNVGKDNADGVVIDIHVNENMVYVDKSAEGKATLIEFSVDGGKTYATPDKLKVKGKDGKMVSATAADLKQIRWTLTGTLKPGASGTVSYRAVLK